MKNIDWYTEEQKIVMRNLRKNSRNSDTEYNEFEIKYQTIRLECMKNALEEYQKHPLNELVLTGNELDDEFADTVGTTISALQEDIASTEKWLNNKK